MQRFPKFFLSIHLQGVVFQIVRWQGRRRVQFDVDFSEALRYMVYVNRVGERARHSTVF
jgi:hypothetical protein